MSPAITIAECVFRLAMFLMAMVASNLRLNARRPIEAITMKTSAARRPFVRPWALGYALLRARQFDAALNEALVRSEAQPNDVSVRELLVEAYWHKGMEKEAAQEWERMLLLGGQKESATSVRQAFARGGFKAVIEWELGDFKKKAAEGYVSPIDFADTYAHLRRKDETIHYLEQAYKEHAPYLVRIQSDPNFDFLHSDPRYQAIVRKMGLPAAQ